MIALRIMEFLFVPVLSLLCPLSWSWQCLVFEFGFSVGLVVYNKCHEFVLILSTLIVPEQVLDGTGWEGGEGCFGLFIIFSNSPLAKEQDGDSFVISSFSTLVFGYFGILVLEYFGIFCNFIFWYFGIFFDSSDSVVKEQDGEEGSFGGGQMRCHQESVCVAHKRHLLNILATMRFRRLTIYFLTVRISSNERS